MADDFVDSPQTQKGDIVQLGLEAIVAQQRERIASLQAFVDIDGRKLAKAISMPTVDYAWAALNTYTVEWFADQLYSPAVLASIAQALIDCGSEYTFLDTSVWEEVVKNNAR